MLTEPSDLWSQGSRDLIFIARRSGIAEVVDSVTLDTVARVHFGFQVERLSPSADGSRLTLQDMYGVLLQTLHADPATLKLEEAIPARETTMARLLRMGAGFFSSNSRSVPKRVDLRESGTPRIGPPDLPERI
jgi:hypothetical protein